MSNVSDLVQALESVYLGGIIEDCVITVKDNTAHIKAMDMTSSVYAQVSSPFEYKDDVIGLGNLSLLIKYLKSYTSSKMSFLRNDNVLTVKPENGGTLKYLLSQVDLVPTYNSEWEDSDDPIKAAVASQTCKLELKEESVKEFLKLMGLFKPNGVTITVSKRGRVSIQGGNTTEHQFTVIIGDADPQEEPISVKLYGNNINAVFSVLSFAKPVYMYMVGGEVLIQADGFAWVLRPLSADSEDVEFNE